MPGSPSAVAGRDLQLPLRENQARSHLRFTAHPERTEDADATHDLPFYEYICDARHQSVALGDIDEVDLRDREIDQSWIGQQWVGQRSNGRGPFWADAEVAKRRDGARLSWPHW